MLLYFLDAQCLNVMIKSLIRLEIFVKYKLSCIPAHLYYPSKILAKMILYYVMQVVLYKMWHCIHIVISLYFFLGVNTLHSIESVLYTLNLETD